MKHFFLLLLICVAGFFLAPAVLGVKPRSAQQYVNAGSYSESDTALYSHKMGKGNRMCCQSTLTIMLDLNALEDVKEEARLVSVMGNAAELGLMLTGNGLQGNWHGRPWGDEKAVPVSRLLDNPNSVRINGVDYLALTVLVNGSSTHAFQQPGITVVDASGDILLSYPMLNTAENEQYTSMIFEPKYISHVMISPKLLSVKGAAKRAARLEKTVATKPGNAMIAFGGGGVVLLVLAALLAKVQRRRRSVAY